MFSTIVVDKVASGLEHLSDALAFQNLIKDGDLFRIAEADPPGSTAYPYARKFLDTIREKTFYDRHAPGDCAPDFRSTRYVFSQHHASAISVSDPDEFDLNTHVDQLYRHMQFMCVFEYLTLLRFSQRLSDHVRHFRDDDSRFTKGLATLREQFLEFTHLHHFSNVSTQLQGRELFEKISQSIGVDQLYAEVDAEIRSATDYASAKTMLRQADNAERLAKLASVGIPASLAVGAAGMNLMIGTTGPGIFKSVESQFLQEALQFTLLSFLIFSAWVAIRKLCFPQSSSASRRVEKPMLDQSAEPDTLMAVTSLIAFLLLLLATVGPNKPDEQKRPSKDQSSYYASPTPVIKS